MSKKKDFNIDYRYSSRRSHIRDGKSRNKSPSMLYNFLVLLFMLGVGVIALYFANMHALGKNGFRNLPGQKISNSSNQNNNLEDIANSNTEENSNTETKNLASQNNKNNLTTENSDDNGNVGNTENTTDIETEGNTNNSGNTDNGNISNTGNPGNTGDTENTQNSSIIGNTNITGNTNDSQNTTNTEIKNNSETIDNINDAVKNINNNTTNTVLNESKQESVGNSFEEPANQVLEPGAYNPNSDNGSKVKVKGIYVTGKRAGSESLMKELVNLVDTTELNAMVIDIKNEEGIVTYDMNVPLVQEIGANKNYIRDIKKLVADLKEKDIYLIARVAAFNDTILSSKKPELSIQKTDGTIFRDSSGHSWLNPYNKDTWNYIIDIAKEAAILGFDEIQFDYIRFPTDSGMKNVDFSNIAKGKTRIDIITEFTKYATNNLKPLGVKVSADVYGTVIDSKTDAQIVGQSYVQMSKYLDYICPMVYPSHYAKGAYGIQNPDKDPYNLILNSLKKSKSVLQANNTNEDTATVRPWLQDFTAVWLDDYQKYDSDEIRKEIDAVYDAGYEEWILWNSSNHYTSGGLIQ